MSEFDIDAKTAFELFRGNNGDVIAEPGSNTNAWRRLAVYKLHDVGVREEVSMLVLQHIPSTQLRGVDICSMKGDKTAATFTYTPFYPQGTPPDYVVTTYEVREVKYFERVEK